MVSVVRWFSYEVIKFKDLFGNLEIFLLIRCYIVLVVENVQGGLWLLKVW